MGRGHSSSLHLFVFEVSIQVLLKTCLAFVHRAPSSPWLSLLFAEARGDVLSSHTIPKPGIPAMLSVESQELTQKYMVGTFLKFGCHPENNMGGRLSAEFKTE